VRSLIATVVMLLASAVAGFAQAPVPAMEHGSGLGEMEAMQGELGSSGSVIRLDSTVTYDFSKHFGVFGGVPFYFVGAPATTTTAGTASTSTHGAGVGNVFLGLVFRAPNHMVNYASAITVAGPTGSKSLGLSSGRGTVDWSNSFDRSFGPVTPFLDAGLSNSVPDTNLVTHPFTSLGIVSHFEEGASLDLPHHFSVGASLYEVVPFGNQKVFSKLVKQGDSRGGSSNGHDGFKHDFLTTGTDLTRENGTNVFVGFEPNGFWSAQAGVSRSMTFGYNSFVFRTALNVGRLLRGRSSS
jgi:hypothetical protein